MRPRSPRPTIAAMARAPRTISLRLDLQTDTEPISGCIEHTDGSRRPFWSWLELMAELEAAVADASEQPRPAEIGGADGAGGGPA